MKITEAYALEHIDRIPEDKLQSVFFPQFRDELIIKSVPTPPVMAGHYMPVHHHQAVSFEEWKAKHYSTLRKYPSIEEQLDYIYHNGVEAWAKDMIEPIKQKNPKPEGV